jgi:RND family efflux transporter MFP subunit
MNETLLQKDKPKMDDAEQNDRESRRTVAGRKKGRLAFRLKLFAFILAVSLIVLALYGIKRRSATTENLQRQADQAIAELTVSVVIPQKAPATISIDLPGQTQAYTQAAVYAQTTGYVKTWNFDIGSAVKEGVILAEIDTPEVDQQLNQAKATLKEAQAALDLASVTYQRDKDLLQRNVIAKQDFDTAESDFRSKQGTAHSDEAAVLRLVAMEDFKLLRAPFEGIVTARNTDIGGMVNAGAGNPLFTIARIKPLRVYINVPESMAHEVSVGDRAELKLDEFPERTFGGDVVRTAGAIDPTSRTLLTEVEVPNEDAQLFPGAYVRVHLSTGGSTRSLLIPANTLLFRSEGAMVGVVGAENKVEIKKIKIGKDLGTHLEVRQGLAADDRVIVNPSDTLVSGQTVRIRPLQDEKKKTAATPGTKQPVDL